MYFYFLQKDATIDHQIKDKALNCQGCGFWDIPFYFECILPDLCSFASCRGVGGFLAYIYDRTVEIDRKCGRDKKREGMPCSKEPWGGLKPELLLQGVSLCTWGTRTSIELTAHPPVDCLPCPNMFHLTLVYLSVSPHCLRIILSVPASLLSLFFKYNIIC